MTQTPPEALALLAGLTIRPEPCWGLWYGPSHPVESGDGQPHYDSRSDAAAEISTFAVEHLGIPVPQREDAPCVLAACVTCGYRFDEEAMTMHHPSIEDTLQALRDCEWATGPSGIKCPDCSPPVAGTGPRGSCASGPGYGTDRLGQRETAATGRWGMP